MRNLQRCSRALRALEANVRIRLPRIFMPRQRMEKGIVVGLTSFPGRISTAWAALESIYRQTVLPEEVILVLSSEEFPNRILPKRIMAFAELGLKINFHPGNIKSYKKLLPLLDEYHDKTIVTADDDVIYPPWWLEKLVEAHNKRPGHVLGYRGAVMSFEGSTISPYNSWPRANGSTPSSLVFLTGMGGILYPPNALPKAAQDVPLAMQLCPDGDDIWFKAMTLLNKTPIAKIDVTEGNFPVVRSAQALALHRSNVASGGNDPQLKAVFDHFDLLSTLSDTSLS